MLPPLTALASVFPWDPQADSPMSHKHLILGYAFAWTAQSLYLLSVLWRSLSTRRKTVAAATARREENGPQH